MGRIPWEGALVASLSMHKADGRSFEVAWSLALRANPPRSLVEREIVASVKVFADDAWHNRRPKLRGFSLEMLRGGDGAREARSSGAYRVDTLIAA